MPRDFKADCVPTVTGKDSHTGQRSRTEFGSRPRETEKNWFLKVKLQDSKRKGKSFQRMLRPKPKQNHSSRFV